MKKENFKTLFIFPPQWLPLNPPFSIIPLYSYLKENGYDSKIIDLNLEFYIHILQKDYLKKALDKALVDLKKLFDYLAKNFVKGKKEEDYSQEFKVNLAKYNKIKEFTTTKQKYSLEAIDKIDDSIAVMRDKELFYNPQKLVEALNNIDFCLEIASLPYFPSVMQFNNFSNMFSRLTFESIVKDISNERTNIFLPFYKQVLEDIKKEKPDVIGVSINSSSQITSALTLCHLLKKENFAKITIGGNFFGRVTETLKNYPEFFEMFCDVLMAEEGEIPTLKYTEYLNGEIPITDVPNILYVENGEVKSTPICEPLSINKHPVSDLSSLELKKYFTPHIVLTQQSSRGCYWRKCSFCDHDFGQKLNLKAIDKFVDELELMNKTYGIEHFELIDECISPSYLLKMSQKIKNRNLKISWFNNARLEKEFDKTVLTEAYSAGLKMLLWGFESASKRVMELINKGVDIDKRQEILKTSRDIGIWNFVFIFFGFPSERIEDALETIEFIKNNTDIISSYGRSVFTLGKHTTLRQTPDKFSITRIFEDEDEFSPSYGFETSIGMNSKKIGEIANLCTQECNKAYKNPLWMHLGQREILFLYLCRYGADKVENMKISRL